jgi:hypothetical protein
MRYLPAILPILAVSSVVAAIGASQQPTPPIVILSGATRGYLAPCGCSDPMSGGIQRRIAKVRQLKATHPTITLDTGEFTQGISEQDRYKAQAVAAATASARPDLVSLSPAEERFGPVLLPQFKDILQSAIGRVAGPPDFEIKPRTLHGVTIISVEAADATEELARSIHGPSVVMYGGSESQAAEWSKSLSQDVIIAYRSNGEVSATPRVPHRAPLITPGTFGKAVITFRVTKSGIRDYQVHRLGPDVPDDPTTKRLYKQYLARVTQSDLFGRMTRAPAKGFVGSEECSRCHTKIHEQWKESAHALAMDTLKIEGHDRDPDCVSCHAVGVEASDGYLDAVTDRALANVGCESCHGPGAEHTRDPKVKTALSAKESCDKCHTRNNSPNFNFLTYWEKIQHGLGKTGG